MAAVVDKANETASTPGTTILAESACEFREDATKMRKWRQRKRKAKAKTMKKNLTRGWTEAQEELPKR